MNTAPEEPAESSASIIDTALVGQDLLGGGLSRATYPSAPGPDNQALDVAALSSEVISVGDIDIPVTDFLNFGEAGVLQSVSEATSPKDARAISTTVGADGSLTLDNIDTADMDNARLDVLQLANSLGFGDVASLMDEAYLEIGALGSEVEAVDGVFQNPDAEHTGDGQYKVGDLIMELRSQQVGDAAAELVDTTAQVDGAVEDSINGILESANLLDPIMAALPAGVTIDASVESDVSGAIREALLAEPITTETSIVSLDLATGTIYVDLAEFMGNDEGARTLPDGSPAPEGLNNQMPNTELIDDQLYPMIADSIHDIIEEVVHIAFRTFNASLGSVKVNLAAHAEVDAPIVGTSTADKTFSASLDGTYSSTECVSEGAGGAAACTLLDTAELAVQPLLETAVTTIRETLLADDGQILYDLFTLIKTDSITAPARQVVEPFLEQIAANVFSVQINHQTTEVCSLPDGTETTGSVEVSALSFGLAPVIDGARLNLGNSGARVDACDQFAAVDPAIVVDPTEVPAGDSTTVTGTGFTPNDEASVQLTDAAGEPVGDPITVPTDENGDFPSTDLPVPAGTEPGDYIVQVTDVATDTLVQENITVTEPDVQALNIGLDPPAVPAGESTEATGTGYTPDSTATVQLVDPDGNDVGDPIEVTTDPEGAFTTEVPVPADAVPGDYTVVGTDDTTGNEASEPLTVTEPGAPAITAVPAEVPAGETTTADGTGYTPDSTATVQLTDADGNEVGDPIEVTTDPEGAFTTEVPVPADAVPGDYTVVGTDDTTGDAASAPLTVTEAGTTPVVTVDPTAVEPGDSTEVSGSDFAPNDEVEVQLVDPEGNAVGDPVMVPTDENGDFVGELPVPEGTEPGDYTVEAVDSEGNEGSASLEILAPGSGPGSIGDLVWDDTNADGVQDDGEPGVPGVTANLLDADGNPVLDAAGDPVTDTTDANGLYTLAGLELGDYIVEFADLPEGKTFSPQAASGDDATDSDANPADGRTDVVSLTEEAPALDTVDAGLIDDAAAGDPVVTVDPTAVEPGESTEVSGSDFAPNDEVEVQLVDPEGNAVGDPVMVPTDENGDFVGELPVPEGTEPGDYTVEAVDSEGNEGSASLEILEPGMGVLTLTPNPDAAEPGETIEVTGTGFTPGEDITVELLDADGNPVAEVTVPADDNGEILTDLVVPEDAVPGPDYLVQATDPAVEQPITAPFEVLEPAMGELMIAADPAAVQPGDATSVTGGGFTADGDVTVELVDADGNVVATVQTTADANGEILTDLTVPADAVEGADYTVRGTDVETDGVAETPFEVLALGAGELALSVDPSEGLPGETTTATGADYTPNGVVTVELVDSDGNVIATVDATADENGAVEAALEVPGDAVAGAYEVVGTDSETGGTASAAYTVLDEGAVGSCGVEPEITVDPTSVEVGGTVTVSGVGFATGTVSVQITNDGGVVIYSLAAVSSSVAQAQAVTAEVGADCTFTVTFQLPADAGPGDYTVSASDDDGNTDDAALTIEGGNGGGTGGDDDNDNGAGSGNGGGGDDNGNGGDKLPSTGATSVMFALLALLLIAGGAVLVRFASAKSGRREA